MFFKIFCKGNWFGIIRQYLKISIYYLTTVYISLIYMNKNCI